MEYQNTQEQTFNIPIFSANSSVKPTPIQSPKQDEEEIKCGFVFPTITSSTSSEYEDTLTDLNTVPSMMTRACGCAKILIVDDSAINRMIMNEYTKLLGIITKEANNGLEAVNICE